MCVQGKNEGWRGMLLGGRWELAGAVEGEGMGGPQKAGTKGRREIEGRHQPFPSGHRAGFHLSL